MEQATKRAPYGSNPSRKRRAADPEPTPTPTSPASRNSRPKSRSQPRGRSRPRAGAADAEDLSSEEEVVIVPSELPESPSASQRGAGRASRGPSARGGPARQWTNCEQCSTRHWSDEGCHAVAQRLAAPARTVERRWSGQTTAQLVSMLRSTAGANSPVPEAQYDCSSRLQCVLTVVILDHIPFPFTCLNDSSRMHKSPWSHTMSACTWSNGVFVSDAQTLCV